MIMVGAVADGGVSLMPSHPAIPIAVITDAPIIKTVANVPDIERRATNITTMTPRYINGTSVCMSRIAASWNALSSIDLPVRYVSMWGYRCSISAAS